jgi:molybdate transport system ATP-binding protein
MSFDVDLSRRLGTTEISARFSGGEGATVLFAPSGAGKTSVLNMVAGLLRPDRGHARVGGDTLFDAARGIDVPAEGRRAGYVFQEPRLFPHLRVQANLRYGERRASAAHQGGSQRPGTVQSEADIVRLLELGPLLDRWPGTLSGGEARRVAIGRALLSGPAFLLLDEPLSSLDRARREEAMRIIERVRDEVRLPMLIVTHDPQEAERLGTQVVEL